MCEHRPAEQVGRRQSAGATVRASQADGAQVHCVSKAGESGRVVDSGAGGLTSLLGGWSRQGVEM